MANERSLHVGIAGASGYVGAELLRWLLPHSHVEVSWVASRDKQGKPLADVLRQFTNCSELVFSAPAEIMPGLDFLFVAFPHGESMGYVADARKQHPHMRIVDLGADFRLSRKKFEKVYERAHVCPDALETAIPGIPDIAPEPLREAQLVANPGCFAHCCILALAPLAARKLLLGPVRISAVTGSSGSGAAVSQRTHHPERHDSLSCYGVFSHRHIPEIEEALAFLGEGEIAPQVHLVPHSGPFSRGIYATCFVAVPESVDVGCIYKEFWQGCPFVRLREGTPRLIDVQGTNFCDMSVYQSGPEVAIVCAIDNLGKGAASNAIQCMNIMAGFDSSTGLVHSGLVP